MESHTIVKKFVKDHNLDYSKYPLHRYLYNVEKEKFHPFVSKVTHVSLYDPVALFVAYENYKDIDYEYYQENPDDLLVDLDNYFKLFLDFFPPTPKQSFFSSMFRFIGKS